MAKQTPLDTLAKHMQDELQHDVPALAQRLQSEMQQAGASKLSRQAYLEYVHRNWNDPQFRSNLLQQVGPEHFLQTAQDVVKTLGHPPIVQPPMLGAPAGGPIKLGQEGMGAMSSQGAMAPIAPVAPGGS